MDSSLAGFYKLPLAERRKKIAELAGLSADEAVLLERFGGLDEATADRMIENVVGTFPLPLGIATNFKINGRNYLVPMAVEEPSVVAAASNGAKVARESCPDRAGRGAGQGAPGAPRKSPPG